MNETEMLHISSSEAFSDRLGEIRFVHRRESERSTAFCVNETQRIELRVPRMLGSVAAELTLHEEDGSLLRKYELQCTDTSELLDVYTAALRLPVGLYFFSATFDTVAGYASVKRTDAGITFTNEEGDRFQLSVYEREREKVSSYLGGVIYHIFVDRFSKDENARAKRGTVIVDGTWDVIPEYPNYPGAPLKNNTFYGGTLYSAAERLDYIASLGVNIVYLSPVFESPSNHKYDTSDYLKVDEMFGGDEALRHFIDEAKKRGIGVILDGVFNHTGADSVYFNRYGNYSECGAYQSKESKYYGWYTFREHPYDYVSWWGIEILPRINTGNESFETFILNEVVKKYRGMGILGMRLDVADELSDGFIRRIKSALSSDGESILFGEVWEDASNKIAYGKRKTYYLGGELDGVMNYPLREGIIDYIRFGDVNKLRYALTEVTENAPRHVRNMQMNLLGTHDTVRILTALGGEDPEGRTNRELSVMRMTSDEREKAEQLLRSAYTVIATLPGIPAIFYGDEAGLEGYGDPFNRMPYPSTPSERLVSHYRNIGKIRRENAVYRDGDLELITLTADRLVFARVKGRTAYLTVFNNSQDPISVDLDRKTPELLSGTCKTTHIIPSKEAVIFRTTREAVGILK